MMLKSPVLRATTLLHKRIAFGDHSKGQLDPSRHIIMSKNFNMKYIDYYPMGQYPKVYVIGSINSKAYQPQVENIILQTLKSRYKIENLNEKQQNFYDTKWSYLLKKIIKTDEEPQEFLQLLLEKLAFEIIIKQSRWTWIKQQEIRLSHSNEILTKIPETIREFIDAYNEAIEVLVSASNLGFAQQIQGELTAQEKHFKRQLDDHVEGIKDLQDGSRKQNSSFINQLMNKLHSF